jgi:hypothetical protein
MTIQSIVISFIERQITAEYIANVLWKQHIAQVKTITLIPYLKNSSVLQIAYIEVAEWCDTEVAYSFVQRLKNPYRETRLVHNSDEEWWVVEEPSSTSFPTSFFLKEEEQEQEKEEEQEQEQEILYSEEDLLHMEECIKLMQNPELLGDEEDEQENQFIDWTLECYQDDPVYEVGPPYDDEDDQDEEYYDWLDQFFEYQKGNVTLRPHQSAFVF